jgi:hypothetical protein
VVGFEPLPATAAGARGQNTLITETFWEGLEKIKKDSRQEIRKKRRIVPLHGLTGRERLGSSSVLRRLTTLNSLLLPTKSVAGRWFENTMDGGRGRFFIGQARSAIPNRAYCPEVIP